MKDSEEQIKKNDDDLDQDPDGKDQAVVIQDKYLHQFTQFKLKENYTEYNEEKQNEVKKKFEQDFVEMTDRAEELELVDSQSQKLKAINNECNKAI